jgi:2-methylisocitrate lyase-like PEP mutase family enzyme
MNQASSLREQLRGKKLLVAPGVYDGLTARIAELAGFSTLYMTGAGTAAARGYPDYGLLTMTEMVDNAGTIARSAHVPLIADADTGFGNELNVTRTVREYEQRGVAGIHIEDQVAPKKCGHLDGKELISRAEFIAKIRAAVAARSNPDFMLIARTDARAVEDFEEAVWRANAALDAGADVAFVEAAQTLEEVAEVPKRVHGPCLFNIVRGGKSPDLGLREIEEMGYRIAILPSLLLGAAAEACERALRTLMETQIPPASTGQAVRERFRRLGADEWDALRTRFRDEAREGEQA